VIVSAVKRDTFIDYTLRSIAIGALSIPGFWIATLVIVLSAHWWGWIPPIGYKAFLKAPVQNVQILLSTGHHPGDFSGRTIDADD